MSAVEEANAPEGVEQNEYENTYNAMRQQESHPLRMKLLWEELYFAREIKEAIEATPELDNLSDFMYSQLALICEDVRDAEERAHALQDFRKEYGIVESYQDGCRALQNIVESFPEHLLSFGFSPVEGIYITALDLAKLESASATPQQIHQFFVGQYYMLHCAGPDFHSIHKGSIGLLDCKDLGWNNRHDLRLLHKLASNLVSIYPQRSQAKHYNTAPVFNVMARAAKKILPEQIADTFELGLRCPDGLSSICLVPDAATAHQRMLQRMQESLRRRFDNESSFSLDWSKREAIVPLEHEVIEAMGEARGLF